MPDSLQPRRLQPARFLCLWNSSGKNTGVGCHFPLQGIFPTQGSNLGLPHCRQLLYHLSHFYAPSFHKFHSNLVFGQWIIQKCIFSILCVCLCVCVLFWHFILLRWEKIFYIRYSFVCRHSFVIERISFLFCSMSVGYVFIKYSLIISPFIFSTIITVLSGIQFL